ncbi:MAG: hypothetical protein MI757_11005, partial [Pirellulales bacterium]|nr:hypothetical protein [Pirellulales bacterium]
MNNHTTTVLAFGLTIAFVAYSGTWNIVQAAPIDIRTVKHDGNVDFEKEILPLLRRNCIACHNSSDAEGDLVLETPQTILKGGGEGPAVVAGKSGDSLLLKLASHQDDPIMPPDDNEVGAKNFTPEELGLIKLWIDQGAKGEVLGSAGPVKWQPLAAAVNAINAVAITDDAQYAAAGSGNHVFLYHLPSKREIGRLADAAIAEGDKRLAAAHLDVVQSLAFAPHGNRLATGGYRVVKLWKRPQNARQGEIAGVSGALSMATSPDGKWAAFGQRDGKIQLVDLASRKTVQTLTGHSGAVAGIAFSADSKTLATGSKDKSCRLWSVADGKQTLTIETPSEVNAVALVAEGGQIATAGADNIIRTWGIDSAAGAEADKPSPVKELKGHTGPVMSLARIADGAQLLSGSQDSTVRVWNVAGGNQIRTMSHGSPVTSVAVRPDGKRFASAGDKGFAKLWDAANGQQLAELKGDITARVRSDAATRAVALAKTMVGLAKKDLEEANKRKKSEEDNA